MHEVRASQPAIRARRDLETAGQALNQTDDLGDSFRVREIPLEPVPFRHLSKGLKTKLPAPGMLEPRGKDFHVLHIGG